MLEANGLIRYRKARGNYIIQDSNLVVTNKEHVGKNVKTYYVVEESNIMGFLGHYENMDLQLITQEQYDKLVQTGALKENKIQQWGTFVPRALCFINQFGEYRIRKVPHLMIPLGLKQNMGKRHDDEDTSFAEMISQKNFQK